MPPLTSSYQIKRSLRTVASIVIVLLAAVGLGWGVNKFFTLQNIEVIGSGIQIELDKNALSHNLLFFPAKQLEQQILRDYPLLSAVSIEKRFPATLIIRVTQRKAIARLLTNGQTYVLDETGVVLGNAPFDAPLPTLQFDLGTLAIGSQVSDHRVELSLLLVSRVKDVLTIDTVFEKDSSTLQAKAGSTSIFLPQNGDIGTKAATLQTIIEGFRIKGTLPTVIDLRFEKPIITK